MCVALSISEFSKLSFDAFFCISQNSIRLFGGANDHVSTNTHSPNPKQVTVKDFVLWVTTHDMREFFIAAWI